MSSSIPHDTSSAPTKPPSLLPQRPACRRSPPRAATLCFWIVLILFLCALVYLGLLAFSTAQGELLPATVAGHLFAGLLVAVCAIAAVAVGCGSRRHPH